MQPQYTSDEQAPANDLDQQRDTLPRDWVLKAGEPLSAPRISETWDMRPNAPDVLVTDYPTGPALTKAALGALIATNNEQAYLFERSGSLVRVQADELGQPRIELVTRGALHSLLMRTAHWYAEVQLPGGRIELRPTDPPRAIASDIVNSGNWPVWPLYGLSPIPVLRADGTVESAPGYDQRSGWYYLPPHDLDGWTPTLDTSPEGVQRAVALLADWLTDFPFESPAEKATAVALFLTMLARTALDGNLPIFLIDAKQSRTGKTLLTETLLAAVLGELPGLTTPPPDETEMKKFLATCALHGQAYVIFDNVAGKLDSPALASLVTSGRTNERLLGGHDRLDTRPRMMLIVTANKSEASTELLARSARCLLNAEMSRPQDRDPAKFTHPNILTWTLERRKDLLTAGFTLLASWHEAGRPVPANLPAKGGFEQWTQLIGGTLAHVGIPDFLGNEHELFEESDQEASELLTFLDAWLAAYGHEPVKVGQLYQDARKPNHALNGALPRALAEVQTSRAVFQSVAGKFLVRQRGVRYGSPDRWLDSRPDAHNGGLLWRVLGGPDHVAGPPAATNGHHPDAVQALLDREGVRHVAS